MAKEPPHSQGSHRGFKFKLKPPQGTLNLPREAQEAWSSKILGFHYLNFLRERKTFPVRPPENPKNLPREAPREP